MNDQEALRSDYEGSLVGGVRGKYFEQCEGGVTAILLEKDVADVFKDAKQVNDILRALIPSLKKQAS